MIEQAQIIINVMVIKTQTIINTATSTGL